MKSEYINILQRDPLLAMAAMSLINSKKRKDKKVDIVTEDVDYELVTNLLPDNTKDEPQPQSLTPLNS